MTESIDAEYNRHELEAQYSLQVELIRKIGSKVEEQLKDEELYLQSLSRTDAARYRATYLKLARDFRNVQLIFKNLQLNARDKRSEDYTCGNKSFDKTQRLKLKESFKDDMSLLQIQLREDRLNED